MKASRSRSSVVTAARGFLTCAVLLGVIAAPAPAQSQGPSGMAADSGSQSGPADVPLMRLPPVAETSPSPWPIENGQAPSAALQGPLQGAPAAPDQAASAESSSLAPRGFGGMSSGRGMGMDSGPGYKVLWMPDQPVRGQPTDLGMVEQNLSLMVPVWKNGADGVAFTTNVRWEIFHTEAILPDSHIPFPEDLWNVRFGALYSHPFQNGWIGGANFGIGSNGDKPFDSPREMAATASGFLRVPQGEHNAWLFMLSFSTNSQVLSGIPIPGVAYFYAPSDVFQATIGFPFASINYHPYQQWRFEFTYALLTTIHTRAIYQPSERIELYTGFDWSNENYELAERVDDQDRLYYYEKRLSAGMQWKFYKQIGIDLSAGYAFDRYYFQGHGFQLTGPDRIDVGSGPFMAAQLKARF
jgi:hypothetical protein